MKLNSTERAMIQAKLDQAQEDIKGEHRKPKSLRNNRTLERAKKLTITLSRWLNNK